MRIVLAICLSWSMILNTWLWWITAINVLFHRVVSLWGLNLAFILTQIYLLIYSINNYSSIFWNDWNRNELINILQNKAGKPWFLAPKEMNLSELKDSNFENVPSGFIFYVLLWWNCAQMGALGCFYMRHFRILSAKIAKSRRMCMTVTSKCILRFQWRN